MAPCQPVVEILAELAIADHLPQVTPGRGHHTNIHGNLSGFADPANHALLEDAEDLGLGLERQVTHFVEQQRSAVCSPEHARSRLAGPGERSPRVAEQLGLGQLLGQRGAVEGDVLPVPAAGVVDQSREQLLARAALTPDQHRRGSGRVPPGQADLTANRGRVADDAVLRPPRSGVPGGARCQGPSRPVLIRSTVRGQEVGGIGQDPRGQGQQGRYARSTRSLFVVDGMTWTDCA